MIARNDTPCQSPAALPALPSYISSEVTLVDPERLTFKVRSGSRPWLWHTVKYPQGWCSCEDHTTRHHRCVHLVDVDAWIAERQAARRAILICGACGERASRLFDDGVCPSCSMVGRRAS